MSCCVHFNVSVTSYLKGCGGAEARSGGCQRGYLPSKSFQNDHRRGYASLLWF